MNLSFSVNRILVIERQCGTDRVLIYTNLPSTVYPYDEPATMVLDVAKGSGVAYVTENFGITPESVQC